METKNNKIDEILRFLQISQTEFAAAIDESKQNVVGWKSRGISKNGIAKIVAKFPQISLQWLVSDIGDISAETDKHQPPSQPTTAYLVPYYANAGQNEGGLQGITANELERVVSPVCGAEYCITIHGESMQPTYPSGCRVFIKKIVANFVPGNTYIIDTADGIMLKRLSYSDNPDRLLCASINPDVLYKPFEMDKSNIFGIYRVLGIFIPINE